MVKTCFDFLRPLKTNFNWLRPVQTNYDYLRPVKNNFNVVGKFAIAVNDQNNDYYNPKNN